MECQKFLPESMYQIDPQMSSHKLLLSYLHKENVTGKVLRINFQKECLEIDLGNSFTGNIPLNDATIYKVKECGLISANIYTLVGMKIRAKVTKINGEIILNRKKSMIEALNYFENLSSSNSLTAVIINFSRLCAFVDLGNGILGRIYAKDFSTMFFRNITDIGFHIGNLIQCKILNFDSKNQWFNLSRIQCLPGFNEVLYKGELVVCKVFDEVLNNSSTNGYYVLIGRNYCGILDSYTNLEYGDLVVGYIKRLGENGPQLRFVKKI